MIVVVCVLIWHLLFFSLKLREKQFVNTDHLLEQHSAYFKTTKLSLASLLVTKFGEMFNSRYRLPHFLYIYLQFCQAQFIVSNHKMLSLKIKGFGFKVSTISSPFQKYYIAKVYRTISQLSSISFGHRPHLYAGCSLLWMPSVIVNSESQSLDHRQGTSPDKSQSLQQDTVIQRSQ